MVRNYSCLTKTYSPADENPPNPSYAGDSKNLAISAYALRAAYSVACGVPGHRNRFLNTPPTLVTASYKHRLTESIIIGEGGIEKRRRADGAPRPPSPAPSPFPLYLMDTPLPRPLLLCYYQRTHATDLAEQTWTYDTTSGTGGPIFSEFLVFTSIISVEAE